MNCVNPRTIHVDGRAEPIQVPCGKCIPDLMNKRADWSFRLEQEYKYSKSAIFVTLTYDQKHAPSDGSLDKRHLQLYLKRLRKKDGTNKIRYYAVGEYGTRSGRPHYHLLLFNANESHARSSWTDSNGDPVGIVHIGSVTPASVAYVTKYIVQPFCEVQGLLKPFATMSRAYGIGGRYLSDEMVQWHRCDDRNYALRDGAKCRLPRFYREKIWPLVKENEKATRVTRAFQRDLIWFKTKDRQRVSSASMALSLENQRKEKQWYVDNHGDDWERIMIEARNAVFARVKTKVAYTQKF